MSDEPQQEQRKDRQQEVTLLEKIATALSALLVAALIAVLLWDASHPDTPPRFTVDQGAPILDGANYRFPVVVHNHGDKSAKAVVVHLELIATPADTVIDESELTIDWLPGQSSRDIVGLFKRPTNGERAGVRAEVRGYVVP